jgi:AI-2 transport protein TqsA
LATITTLVLALLIFCLGVFLVSSSVRRLAAEAGAYQQSIDKIINESIETLPLDRIGINSRADLDQRFRIPTNTVRNMILNTTNTLLDVVQKSVLVLIFVFFLLIGKKTMPAEASGVWSEIETRVKRYLVAKAGISALTGTLVGVVLSLLGVDLAMVFGLTAFLLNFIPSVGSIIATLLPLPVVLISPDATLTTVLLAFVLPGSIQVTIGNVVEPKILGDSLDLHPVALLATLIFWGMLWGIVGMFLAVPMTAILKILLERYSYTRPFAHAMAGKFEKWEF